MRRRHGAWDINDVSLSPTNGEIVSDAGALLRATRMRLGEDLHDIAAMLHIRYPYLEAIEEGRYADLPGPTYAVGFVRAYAENLGLDRDEVVRRFKAETTGIARQADLRFPSPIPEGGVPGGAILFVGAIIALLAYGGWYLSTSQDNFLAEIVPPLPDRLIDKTTTGDATQATAAPADQGIQTVADPTASSADRIDQGTEPQSSDAATTTDTAEAPTSVDTGNSTTTTEPETTTAANPSDTPPAANAEAPAPTADSAASAATDDADASTAMADTEASAGTAGNDASSDAANADAAADDEEPSPSVIASVGSEESDRQLAAAIANVDTSDDAVASTGPAISTSRIVVQARTASWIQVRDDAANQLLLTRLLRPGDVYEVPDRPGLTLLTGNAGALEILVDGEAVPPLGPLGLVRRDVALDADRLRAGTAVRN
jgi:cytoskeleton protein RodZ